MNIRREQGERFAALLGAELKGAIKSRGRTANDVADRIGIERATLNRYLNGKRIIPSSTMAVAAIEIGMEPPELVRRAYERFKSSTEPLARQAANDGQA
ncbi:MAG: helix-turn-helix domain-containing protein [Propionibacteriaceae bacterium]|nr:helix-turn-helix domain-containing protein [Propionibacteriaceae bacterium]